MTVQSNRESEWEDPAPVAGKGIEEQQRKSNAWLSLLRRRSVHVKRKAQTYSRRKINLGYHHGCRVPILESPISNLEFPMRTLHWRLSAAEAATNIEDSAAARCQRYRGRTAGC